MPSLLVCTSHIDSCQSSRLSSLLKCTHLEPIFWSSLIYVFITSYLLWIAPSKEHALCICMTLTNLPAALCVAGVLPTSLVSETSLSGLLFSLHELWVLILSGAALLKAVNNLAASTWFKACMKFCKYEEKQGMCSVFKDLGVRQRNSY